MCPGPSTMTCTSWAQARGVSSARVSSSANWAASLASAIEPGRKPSPREKATSYRAKISHSSSKWKPEVANRLREDEVAFYDAVVQNDAAVLELGDETLKTIARKLVKAVCASVTIDRNLKDSVQAELRSKVRRLLAVHDDPPDTEEKAIALVLEQAELFASAA